MKNIITLNLAFIFLHVVAWSQINEDPPFKCGHDHARSEMQLKNEAFFSQSAPKPLSKEKLDLLNRVKNDEELIIPVVFHILHNDGPENISDEQIFDVMRILNEDFKNINADKNEVIAPFQPIVGNPNITFKLAKIAPNGKCFNGITRTIRTTNEPDGGYQLMEVLDGNDVYQGVWPHFKYLNIIIADTLPAEAAGYTFLPAGWDEPDEEHMYYNSIYVLHNYLGSIGTSTYGRSRTLTHEVGHWLNLSHVWGAGDLGNCGDDFVSDTPQTAGSSSCDLTLKTCDNTLDNVQNYMNYSYCMRMFTQGQAERMQIALFDFNGGRFLITEPSNLIETGVVGESNICNADIRISKKKICAGSSVNYTLEGTSSSISSYSWNFPGGNPSVSTASNPTVSYPTAGSYEATVTIVSNGIPTTFNLQQAVVVEGFESTTNAPLVEGFEAMNFPPTNWSVTNLGNEDTWKHALQIGYAPTTEKSAMINSGFQVPFGKYEELSMPPIDLSNQVNVNLSFDVAYRAKTSGRSERLEVLASKGCGYDFDIIFAKHHADLKTEEPSPLQYTNPTNWRAETINLNNYSGYENVRIKFRVSSERASILYLDNVNLSSEEGTLTADFGLSQNAICVDKFVTISDQSILATSWEWDFGAAAIPSTATGIGPHQVTYTTEGEKTITLTINGMETISKQLTVNPCLGIDELSNQTLSLFPNPTKSEVSISCSDRIQSYTLYDNFGRILLHAAELNDYKTTIYTNQLSSGNYLIQVVTAKGSQVLKLIKE